jgi:hypothetical protein
MLLVSRLALADQCAWITEKEATDAAKVIHPGDRVREYCEPCGERKPALAKLTKVKTLKARPVEGQEGYWELALNGDGTDLAYLYLESKEKPGRWDNVAALVDCKTEGVSPFLTVYEVKRKP